MTTKYQTRVRNTDTVTNHFSFLPPHGLSLAAGGEADLDGSLEQVLRDRTKWDNKDFAAYQTQVNAGKLTTVVGYGAAENAGAKTSSVSWTIERGTAYDKTTVFKLSSLAVTMTDGTTNGSIGGAKLYDFPRGLIYVGEAVSSLTVTAATGIVATATLKHALGTVVAATDDSLATTQSNILPVTSTVLVASAGAPKGVTATALGLLDGTTTSPGAARAVYLNFGVADAGSTANSTVTVSGTITLRWRFAADK